MKEMEVTEQHQTSTPKKMEFEYLSRITKEFSTVIGSGGFGTVYKGKEKDEFFAVKKLNVTVKLERDDTQFMNEVALLMDLDHPNIVRLKGYCYHIEELEPVECNAMIVDVCEVHRLLCFEYLPYGSLTQHLKDEFSGLDWHVRYKIIEGICNGLHYLHEGAGGHILHLDLKPDNILLDEYMEPKIGDFGLSRSFGQGRTHISTANISGTPGYIAPECIGQRHIRKESDIYSLGVVIIEIVAGQMKYPECTSRQEYTVIRENWRQRLQTTSTSLEEDCEKVNRCIDLALMCMEQEPRRRPNIERIIEILRTHENISIHAFEIEEDSAIPHENTSEEQAALLHRPKTVLKSEEMGQYNKMSKKRQPQGMWNFSMTALKRQLTGVEMLKFGFMILGVIAIVTFLVLLVSKFPFVGQFSFTVEDASLTRFALVTTPPTTLAYNISMTLGVFNHNWVMTSMYIKMLSAAYYFDGQKFDNVLLADGGKLTGKHTTMYRLAIVSENAYIRLGNAGVAAYKKDNATGVFELVVRITGEMSYAARFSNCKIEAICPLKLQLAPPGTSAVVFQKVKCKFAKPDEKYC